MTTFPVGSFVRFVILKFTIFPLVSAGSEKTLPSNKCRIIGTTFEFQIEGKGAINGKVGKNLQS